MRKINPIIVDLISLLIIILALLALLSYYFNIGTRIVDLIIILLMLALSIDCYLYKKHTKYKKSYFLLALLFFLIAFTHSSRFFFGPIHCTYFDKLFSVYFYDSAAFMVGLLLVAISIKLIKKRSGERYHHLAAILIGSAMIINHTIKMIIGRCV